MWIFSVDISKQQGTHLYHLGVQPLAHLHTTMSQQHSPISVDMHQGSSLVMENGTKAYTILCWDDSQPSLLPTVMFMCNVRICSEVFPLTTKI